MAQLKSTSVTGNLSVTGNVVASQIIKLNGTEDQLLKANGEVESLSNINSKITNNTDAISVTQTTVNKVQKTAEDALPKVGGDVKGHIYLTGANANSSTDNTSQIIFGTSSDQHVAISSNNNTLVINPTASSTTNQIVLYLDKPSQFPNGISANITGNLSGTATKATQDADGNVISNTYLKLAGDTMTGPLAVTGTGYFDNDLKIKGHVFAYNYSRDGNNAPAVIWDKNGGNYTGVGSHNLTDTIWFGAVNPDSFTWIDDYKQKWKFNGSVEAESYNAISDARLKENFIPLTTQKSILDLPIYKFDFINGTKNQIGCKAQDLQEICPEIVNEDGDGYLSIQESKIVYLLIDEIKKLKGQLDSLNKTVREEH